MTKVKRSSKNVGGVVMADSTVGQRTVMAIAVQRKWKNELVLPPPGGEVERAIWRKSATT